MTVIVTDGEYVVSDGLAVCNNHVVTRAEKKLFVAPGKFVLGVAGSILALKPMAQWVLDGMDPRNFPPIGDRIHALLILPGERYPLLYSGQPFFDLVGKKRFAIGSGCEYAQAILEDGGSAIRAAKVACRCNIYCGGRLQIVKLADVWKK